MESKLQCCLLYPSHKVFLPHPDSHAHPKDSLYCLFVPQRMFSSPHLHPKSMLPYKPGLGEKNLP